MKSTLEILQFDKLKSLIEKHIQTQYGRELLSKLKPIFNIEKAKREYEIQKEFFSYFIKWGTFLLSDIYISEILKEATYSILDEKQLKDIGDFLYEINQIESELKSTDKELYEKHLDFDIPLALRDEITKCIDEHGLLKDTASVHLFEIREEKKSISNNIVRALKNMMHSRLKDIIIDTAVFLKRDRYTILLKPNFKEYINGRIIDIGKSGGLFVEPDAVYEMNNTLEDLKFKEEAERRRILINLTQLVRENTNRLKYNEHKLAMLDLFLAKFLYSKKLPECEITFLKKPCLYGKRVKHPILADIKEDTKPVDIDLKNNRALIVTGPNTGGKTVFLKTIGLTILSVFSGIPVNAERLEIGEFDNVFAIIGDEQDIFESLSGFSAKVESFNRAYKMATNKSIILIDEIGSGTSPDEGEAIAYAIIKKTYEKCTVCATSHYKKLAYLLKSEGFPTAAFEFDEKTLKPTYRLLYNRVGKSYGIDILKSMDIDSEIVKIAQQFYSNNSTILSKLEKELNKSISIYEQKKNELAKLKKEYLSLLEEEKQEKAKLLEELKEEQQRKKIEYETLLATLKDEIAQIMKSKNISKAHKNMSEIRKDAERLFKDKEVEKLRNSELKEGDLIEFNGMVGNLIKIKGKRAIIEIDGKVLEVAASMVKKAKNEKPEQNDVKVYSKTSPQSFELNIIGKRRDEAYFELLRFIDTLAMDGIKKARIVHGLGSGILKDMVRETLKTIPHVKSFRPAPPQEGGDGATLVELK